MITAAQFNTAVSTGAERLDSRRDRAASTVGDQTPWRRRPPAAGRPVHTGFAAAALELVDELVALALTAKPAGGPGPLTAGRRDRTQRRPAQRPTPARAAPLHRGCCSTPWTPAHCAAPRRSAPGPGSPSDRRCSDCCAPTTRCWLTGSATSKLPGCPAGQPVAAAAGTCTRLSWRRRPNSSSTCGPDRMRRWAGFRCGRRRRHRGTSRRTAQRGHPLQQGAIRAGWPGPGEHPIRADDGRGGGYPPGRDAGGARRCRADRHRPGLSRL